MGRSENFTKFCHGGLIVTSTLLLVVSLFSRQGLSENSPTLISFGTETLEPLTPEHEIPVVKSIPFLSPSTITPSEVADIPGIPPLQTLNFADFSRQGVSGESCNFGNCPTLAQAAPINIPPQVPQPDPNRDRFLPRPPIPPKPEPPPNPELTPTPTPAPTPSTDETPIPVQQINVTGSTILTLEEIKTLVNPLENTSTTLTQIRELADKITAIYLEQGYITSRAIVPEQTINNGIVEIQVIEGTLENIEVEGIKRLHPSYITSRIHLGATKPLSTAALENQLRLLRINPLFETVEASLRAGTQEGQSILIVRVVEAPPFGVSLNVDNYSPPSIGSERMGISVRHLNLTGRGDFLGLSYNTTRLIANGDSDIIDALYSIPINPMNGTIQLRVQPYQNRITQEPFNALNIEGKSQRYEISYRQPIIRNPISEFALSFGFAYQDSQTFLDNNGEPFASGPDSKGYTRTSVLKFGQDYLIRDTQGAWALRSQFNLGLDILGATDVSTPNAAFFSWLGQVQRVQRLGENNLLIAQGDIQLSADPLFPSQQFVIGGALSLRGYRQNVRAGDNGFRISFEDRITLDRNKDSEPVFQLAPFLDFGGVWNHDRNPNRIVGKTFLAGAGLGLIWQPVNGLNLRLDYGIPLISISDRGNNIQDDGIYFSVTYTP
ncbi:ShlB/FhaC/HecB family hemolysin secretion/activation protein [Planktothrix agardhii]|jgi:hemolysin activation/secretion protein|uniref:ShlB/FhaC/HecB family hemolysin secretion/activation protein n=1 Tax=Planktothrix agardhii TaxID=1160 RepID=UPI003783729E